MAADLRVIAEYKDLVRQGINPKRHRDTQYRANQRRQKTFREVSLEVFSGVFLRGPLEHLLGHLLSTPKNFS